MPWIISLIASLLHFSLLLLFFNHFIKLFLFFPFLLLTNLLCHPRQISVAEYVSLCLFFFLVIVLLQCITNAFTSVPLLHGVEAEIKSVNQRTLWARTMDGLITRCSVSTHMVLSQQECSIYWEPYQPNNYQSQHRLWYWSTLLYWDCYFRLASRFISVCWFLKENNHKTGLVIKLELPFKSHLMNDVVSILYSSKMYAQNLSWVLRWI